MTHFAGVFAKLGAVRVDEHAAELKRHLSRFPNERVNEFSYPDCYLCSFDLSGEAGAEFVETPDRLTISCGRALFVSGGEAAILDKQELARRLPKGTDQLLTARGVFCGVSFDKNRRELTLFTDRLAVRPYYYYEDERIVVFASALRIPRNCSFCATDIDLLGTVEFAYLGGPLANRTRFDQLKAARAAEVVHVSKIGVSSTFYWRWDEIEPRRSWPEDGSYRLRDLFYAAVEARRSKNAEAHAFLSGGMDSRSIVASLDALGSTVRTYSFSMSRSLDERLPALYAAAVGVRHTARPQPIPEVQVLMARELRTRFPAAARLPPAWSGDGGSVGFGHVYFEQSATEAIRQGRPDEAIERFLAYINRGLPRRIFSRSAYDGIRSAFHGAIRDEISKYHARAKDRWLYLFVLTNEQRAHLTEHFENLDVNRLELVLPFFDWPLIEYICSLPFDDCLWHRAYCQFFDLLPQSTRAVPWQTYPDHIPCPLPMPKGTTYQWHRRQPWSLSLAQRMKSVRALRYAMSPGFPSRLLDRQRTSLLALLDISLVSDRAHEMAAVALCAEVSRPGRKVLMPARPLQP